MFNESVIICAYWYVHNNVVLVHAMTAVPIIPAGFLFLSRFAKSMRH